MKRLARMLLCLAMAASIFAVHAQNESQQPVETDYPDVLLKEKIEFYRRLYPEITFVIMQGGDDWQIEMMGLDVVLGHQPVSLDYEHPPELREDLMFVSSERILMMLKSKSPSASLFKADTPLGWQEHVCVLTINPAEVAADSIRATGHLLDLPQAFIDKIPRDLQLAANDYLAFVIDHEVYHCLKSRYVGPQLMSFKEFWAEYNHFQNEQGADAYALAMHIKTRGEISPFARNLLRVRSMALYNADPDHLTCRALEQVIKVPTGNIIEMSSSEIFDMANNIKNRLTPGYDEYVQYLASAVQAMQEIGVGELVAEELRNRIKGIQPDPVQVKELVANTRRCFSELRGDDSEP